MIFDENEMEIAADEVGQSLSLTGHWNFLNFCESVKK